MRRFGRFASRFFRAACARRPGVGRIYGRARGSAPALLVACALLLVAPVALAQTAAQQEADGMAALSAGKFADAVRALDASYRQDPVPRVLFNLARAYQGMGYPDKALQAYESFVQYGDPSKDAQNLSTARREIDTLKKGYARFNLKLTPPDATIKIDGELVRPEGPELWVPTGSRRIVISAPNYETYEQNLAVIAGRFDLEVQLREPSGPPDVRAAALIDEGIALAASGNAAGALEKYQQAQAIFPTPRGTAQSGLANEQLGDYGAAEQQLTEALAERKDPYIREHRRTLQKKLREIRRNMGTLEIQGGPDGAVVLVNNIDVGSTPFSAPVRVRAGSLTITASREGYLGFEELLELPTRGKRTVVIRMDEAPPPVVAPVVVPPPVAEPVPSLQPEQQVQALNEPPPQEPEPEPQAASQSDIESFSDPQEDLQGAPDAPRKPATGFETSLNFGYVPWIGGPKLQGSSGYLAPQIVMGARPIWPLSFGVQINGGWDSGTDGTKVIANANPGIYVRGHVQQEKRAPWFDVWGGLGLQPFAMQVAVLELDCSDLNIASIDINNIGEKEQTQIAACMAGGELNVDRVQTVQSINVPLELGATLWITEGFGIDLAMNVTFWLPQQDCLHDGSDTLCTDSSLDSQTSMFIGGGVAFLP